MHVRADIKMVRQINLSSVLEIIRRQGPISRAEIAKLAQLSASTVSNLVDELMTERLITSIGEGTSSGGRRPIMYRFCPESRLAIGIEVTIDDICIGLADMDGNLLQKITLPTINRTSREFIEQLKIGINQILNVGKNIGVILGIGIAIPGIVSKDRKSLVYSASLGLRNVAIVSELAKSYDYPILLENDINASALGEKSMGAGEGLADLIYVSISHGVGAGVILNNQIHTGFHGWAGEFGHMTADLHGPLCECGSRGCLGPMAAGPGLFSKITHILAMNVDTKLRSITGSKTNQLTIEHVREAIELKDNVAMAVLAESMEYIGMGIANMITFLDPPLVILGGTFIDSFGDLAVALIQESAMKRVLPNYTVEALPIVSYKLGGNVGVLGAVTLVLSEFLSLQTV